MEFANLDKQPGKQILELLRVIFCLGVLCSASCERANEVGLPVLRLQEIPGISIGIAVLCDSASDTDGKLRIDGTMDTVTARAYPAIHDKMTLVVRLIFTPAEYRKHDLKVRFIDPDGASFGGEMTGEIDATVAEAESPILSKNVIINLHDFRLAKPGVYCVQIWLNEKLLNQTHFIAKLV